MALAVLGALDVPHHSLKKMVSCYCLSSSPMRSRSLTDVHIRSSDKEAQYSPMDLPPHKALDA
jgi:hypothetical protein